MVLWRSSVCADQSQCNAIHKTIVEQFKHAIVYGQSVKHQPQRVGLSHELADEDISKCSEAPSACLILTVHSHDHKTMIVLNEPIQRGSLQSRRTVPRSSYVNHCRVNGKSIPSIQDRRGKSWAYAQKNCHPR